MFPPESADPLCVQCGRPGADHRPDAQPPLRGGPHPYQPVETIRKVSEEEYEPATPMESQEDLIEFLVEHMKPFVPKSSSVVLAIMSPCGDPMCRGGSCCNFSAAIWTKLKDPREAVHRVVIWGATKALGGRVEVLRVEDALPPAAPMAPAKPGIES